MVEALVQYARRDRLQAFWGFVTERHKIFLRKWWFQHGNSLDALPEWCRPHPMTGVAQSWSMKHLTDDDILAKYRFCNVYRELDAVTVWIDQHIRKPFADHPDLWFMLAAARTINWPPTMEYLMNRHGGWPNSELFNPENMGHVLDEWKAKGNKVYTGAYMIRAESDQAKPWYSWTKQRYVAEIVLGRLWEDRLTFMKYLDPNGNSYQGEMQFAWNLFQHHRYVGWGPFMAYQAVVDMRWTRLLRNATDIQTWAALGPGSRRGLNRLHERDVSYNLSQDQGLDEMRELHGEQDEWRHPCMPPIDLSDIQNCLCEFDKYRRALLGEGRPRSMYVVGRDSQWHA